MSAFQPPGATHRDPIALGRAATIALLLSAAVAAAAALAMVILLQAGNTLTFAVSGTEIDGPAGFRVFQMVSFLVSTVTQVLWLAWQYRVHTNARLAAPDRVSTGPGWGVLCWFVPFVNFVKPFLVMREIRRASVPHRAGGRWILGLWWACWIGPSVAGVLVAVDVVFDMFETLRRSTMPQRVVVELDEGSLQLIAAAELSVILAAVFGVLLIREVTRSQVALGRAIADASGSVPPRPDAR